MSILSQRQTFSSQSELWASADSNPIMLLTAILNIGNGTTLHIGGGEEQSMLEECYIWFTKPTKSVFIISRSIFTIVKKKTQTEYTNWTRQPLLKFVFNNLALRLNQFRSRHVCLFVCPIICNHCLRQNGRSLNLLSLKRLY